MDVILFQIFGGADKTSPLLTEICSNTNSNITLTSSGNTMLLYFKTDGSYDGTGFFATYSTALTGKLKSSAVGLRIMYSTSYIKFHS